MPKFHLSVNNHFIQRAELFETLITNKSPHKNTHLRSAIHIHTQHSIEPMPKSTETMSFLLCLSRLICSFVVRSLFVFRHKKRARSGKECVCVCARGENFSCEMNAWQTKFSRHIYDWFVYNEHANRNHFNACHFSAIEMLWARSHFHTNCTELNFPGSRCT